MAKDPMLMTIASDFFFHEPASKKWRSKKDKDRLSHSPPRAGTRANASCTVAGTLSVRCACTCGNAAPRWPQDVVTFLCCPPTVRARARAPHSPQSRQSRGS